MATHDMLQQHALSSKALPTKVKDVLSSEVIAINVIKSYGLNHHLSCAFLFFNKKYQEYCSFPWGLGRESWLFFFFLRLDTTVFLKYVKKMHHISQRK